MKCHVCVQLSSKEGSDGNNSSRRRATTSAPRHHPRPNQRRSSRDAYKCLGACGHYHYQSGQDSQPGQGKATYGSDGAGGHDEHVRRRVAGGGAAAGHEQRRRHGHTVRGAAADDGAPCARPVGGRS